MASGTRLLPYTLRATDIYSMRRRISIFSLNNSNSFHMLHYMVHNLLQYDQTIIKSINE